MMAIYLVFPVHSFCVCIRCFHMGEQSQEGFFVPKVPILQQLWTFSALVKILFRSTVATVLLDPLFHLHGVQFGVVFTCRTSVAGGELSNESQKFPYTHIYICIYIY